MNHAGSKESAKLLYGWLMLSVFSLVFAGVFALLVALARTPVIEGLLPLGRDYIYVALVGHVVLAVVIWFLAFQGFLWLLTSTVDIGRKVWSEGLGWASLASSGAGMALVVVSAVFGLGFAELANYVPVLLTPYFYAGLAFFALGILLNLINTAMTLIGAKREGVKLPTVTFAMAAAGFTVFTAFVCFGLSGYFQVSTGKIFDFERLFWGGGHILQFANTISMAAVWIYLAKLTLKKEPLSAGASKALFAFFLLFVLPAPAVYFIFDTSTQAYKETFTTLMQWGLGPSTAVFILAVLALMYTSGRRWSEPGFASLVLSMAIFLLGGLIAVNINGVNTIIPAHYHCVIGAVTIAFMGLFYEIAPVAVERPLWSKRLAVVQPYLYTLGIVLFAVGLFLAGSHGVARKTYGGEQNLNNLGKLIGMSIMGIGGLVAIAGGITFVLNALLTLFGKKSGAREPSGEFSAVKETS